MKAELLDEWLPVCRADMDRLGWDALDVLLVTGDAYVDHPSFGAALLGRWLGKHGFRVGIVAQPRWDTVEDIARMGRPRLFAGVTAGALDSMLAHYTAFRKLRHDDAYTPGGRHGARPNRASIVYTGLLRQAFPKLPVALGGIEASLRRVAHYDFWTDKIRRSILLDSKADLIVYGMGERAVLEIARWLDEHPGEASGLRGIPGTVFAGRRSEAVPEGAELCVLPSYEEIVEEPFALMTATLTAERVLHQGHAWLVQSCGGRDLMVTPPAMPLSTAEMDALYGLPFMRRPHPDYTEPVPASDMIAFSVTAHRGCAGGCAFCALAMHQGRRIASRSAASVLAEVRRMTQHPDWAGSVSDVGGATANLWGARCEANPDRCARASCLHPAICPHFRLDQAGLTALLGQVSKLAGVKNVRVASGVRFDAAMGDVEYVAALIERYVGGQLKLAPEHSVGHVLDMMRKPPIEVFDRFLELFTRYSGRAGKAQYVVPYLMSAFPGCTDADMRALARWLKARDWQPQQVQCFVPTPGTVATAMFYSGRNPAGEPVYVAKTDAERLRQHHILLGNQA